jgi:hypothetical protein
LTACSAVTVSRVNPPAEVCGPKIELTMKRKLVMRKHAVRRSIVRLAPNLKFSAFYTSPEKFQAESRAGGILNTK